MSRKSKKPLRNKADGNPSGAAMPAPDASDEWRAAQDAPLGEPNIFQPGPGDRRAVFGVVAFLVVIVWVVFGQTLGFGFVNFDDDQNVYDNSHVTAGLTAGGIAWAFTHTQVNRWAPVTTLSRLLDCSVYGTWPGGHHLTNVLLHAASAILLFLVLRQMTGAMWRSAFVAAVFAIHPLRAESVAWVSARGDVTSTFFFMLTLLAYGCHVRNPRGVARYCMVVCLFALSLMSKSVTVTLPFVLLLLDWWPLRRLETGGGREELMRSAKTLVLEKAPLFALSILFSVIAVLAGKESSGEQISFAPRIENAMVSYAIYIWQTFYPVRLAALYPHMESSIGALEVSGAVLLLAGISGWAWWQRKQRPWLLAGWLWYAGMMLPMVGIISTGRQSRADRYTYLPQIGIIVMVTWLACEMVSRQYCTRACLSWRRWLLGTISAAVLMSLVMIARNQVYYWHDDQTLWTHTLAITGDNYVAQNNLGNSLQETGALDDAIAHFKAAIEIKPDFLDSYYNLGNALQRKGRLDAAIEYFQKGLDIKPDSAEILNNLGIALQQKGQPDEAIAQYQKALKIDPEFAAGYCNLGNALAQKGRFDEAIASYQKALQVQPEYAEALKNTGNAYLQKGEMDEAISFYQKAIFIEPDYAEALNAMGNAYQQKGELDKAISCYQKGLRHDPGHPKTLNNLALALAQEGRLDEAISSYQKALEMEPEFAAAHYNLGLVLQQKSEIDQAIAHFQRVLELQPQNIQAGNNLAWLLATCANGALRNGTKAVELAERMNQLSGGGQPVILVTLAAAYAETGQFPKAVETAQKALQLANGQGNAELAGTIQGHIKLYQAGTPLRISGMTEHE